MHNGLICYFKQNIILQTSVILFNKLESLNTAELYFTLMN